MVIKHIGITNVFGIAKDVMPIIFYKNNSLCFCRFFNLVFSFLNSKWRKSN